MTYCAHHIHGLMQVRLVLVLDNPENFVTIVAYGLHDVILGWLHGWTINFGCNVRTLRSWVRLIRIDCYWFSRYL